jgi:hypothetical protein
MGIIILIETFLLILLFVVFASSKRYSELRVGKVVAKFSINYENCIVVLFDRKIDGNDVTIKVEYKVPKEYYDSLEIGKKVCLPL